MNFYYKHPYTIKHLCQGILSKYIASYVALLQEHGYSKGSAQARILLVRDFSRWLDRKRISLGTVNEQTVQRYHRVARGGKGLRNGDALALRRLLALLRQLEVVPPKQEAEVTNPCARIVAEFGSYLATQRRLAPKTIKIRSPFVERFLSHRFKRKPVDTSAITASDAIGFIRRQARMLSPCEAKHLVSALRSFLRYLQHQGHISGDVAVSLPRVPSWSLTTLPRFLPQGAVKKVLRLCNHRTAAGRRDYAILLLLARLGLRAGEVAALTLEDIDWEAGRITIHGKGRRSDPVPLPNDVGNALAAYLKRDRPRCTSRSVFIRQCAPLTGFANYITVSSLVRRYLLKAGIDSVHKGAHVFRHTLATDLLRRGCSLDEIGELLRHKSPETTAIYAKVDLNALRRLALAWPGGAR